MKKISLFLIIVLGLCSSSWAQSGVPKYASGKCIEFTYFQQKLSCSTVMYLADSSTKASLIFIIDDTTYYFTGQANSPTFSGEYIVELESVAKMKTGQNADVFQAEGRCTARLVSEDATLTNLTFEAQPRLDTNSML